MDFGYQADIARSLGRFVDRGLVYKGKKPVLLVHPRSDGAWRKAEVEYEDHTSPSIYVEFPLNPGERDRARQSVCPSSPVATCRYSSGRRRPGTIPSNLAIAFHPAFDYAGLRSSTGGRSSSPKE
jgi:isoleucyl-tRNA synthetase